MADADSCLERDRELVDGAYGPIRFGAEPPAHFGLEPGEALSVDRCGDCGVLRGGVHHPGCEFEQCPRCGGQLIGCDCSGEEL
jgi:hypothetical protein